ncbi:F0F1 ATP synthase subunit gamma [Pediococcus claussenii]|uniref:ATP synthase gamma chain n=1 Tax=Pediococcus claussenii (strain ATCC BAA-344 / DSM 14800 / JCM 18046 / KCTC 3811 / LMG 21948 / P06) TaxID=701521 RepID=G8PCH3_PEDCP|nr:F0F1 ATP synthase subunit gamma [Pediococcus claussenii]AEV94958.1 ATP synthase F1, gamma subunit [Pediococcus claussenii ATCC BAA-344]ANZ70148.1 F0F1 ATP synthase subunit gamma [Pediococcus claussenii]ANZ71964.1 F0F1 ATP synthase subunit gamma [Pediococcus claussenii]KRN19239.1 atpG protein [Pediococcus claussenii]
MAISEQDVKRRIDSTRKTNQITTAMQMVSTAKLNQIQKHTVGYQVYAQKVESIVAHLAKSHLMNISGGSASHSNSDQISAADLLRQRPVKKSAYLVITSDRGLVGSYNSNVIKQTNDFMKQQGHSEKDSVVLAVGGTGADFYKNRGVEVAYEYRGVSDVPTFNEVREIVKTVTRMYSEEKFDELFVCYNHFVNRLSNHFRSTKMLPIGDDVLGTNSDNTAEVQLSAEYDTEPSPEVLLGDILPQYAESLVYGAILDAKTAEHASSSSAMKSASDNASDLIASLELQYNRARQSAITTEITEITGGMAALD